MLSTLQFEAQNARITQTLRADGANSSLFALYLAMQIDDPAFHTASEQVIFQDDRLYAGIEKGSAPKANLYSQSRDYELQDRIYSQVQSSAKPQVYLAFLNCFMPQALHHSSEAELLPGDLLANLPFDAKQKYSHLDSAEDAPMHAPSSQEESLNTFFSNLESARDYDL